MQTHTHTDTQRHAGTFDHSTAAAGGHYNLYLPLPHPDSRSRYDLNVCMACMHACMFDLSLISQESNVRGRGEDALEIRSNRS